MIRTTIIAIATLAMGVGPGFAAELGKVTGFKKSNVPAKADDNSRLMLNKSGTAFPITIVSDDTARKLIQIDTPDGLLWVRLSDVVTDGYGSVIEKTCLSGEITVAQVDRQLGATQMGSGEHHCDGKD